jgi:hypothetical protein
LEANGGRSTPEPLRAVLRASPSPPEMLQTRRIIDDVLADAERRSRALDGLDL